MAAGKTHVADPLDNVHHEMDKVAHSHHVHAYISVESNSSWRGSLPIHMMSM